MHIPRLMENTVNVSNTDINIIFELWDKISGISDYQGTSFHLYHCQGLRWNSQFGSHQQHQQFVWRSLLNGNQTAATLNSCLNSFASTGGERKWELKCRSPGCCATEYPFFLLFCFFFSLIRGSLKVWKAASVRSVLLSHSAACQTVLRIKQICRGPKVYKCIL